ncbi:cytochrome C oxidase subunit IV family protein [Natronomonas sp. F2-12]|jgi:cytochrome c oxidase subunit 4|uniref:Cytochrome C oxidase subunit IV family protein n=1 Tax=Natronomonas aquatica TaxID=2841590 RepID=A0A9R1CUN4_9EURY|nr:cytochrome C oxidase subunit IV family protein [Natronomonas aquatica]MCQ4334277.1 cytochrome C oxidase subunit IV family protein [Natronomonas aquatica]
MASDSLKLYTGIYVALIALAASKYLFFHTLPFGYWQAFAATMTAAVLKTTLIIGYYQHLRSENRSLTWLMALSLGLVMLLMAAASYSIT